jgi:hypothetical protein
MYDIVVSADRRAAPPGEPAQCGHGSGIRSQEQRPVFLGGIVRFNNESSTTVSSDGHLGGSHWDGNKGGVTDGRLGRH